MNILTTYNEYRYKSKLKIGTKVKVILNDSLQKYFDDKKYSPCEEFKKYINIIGTIIDIKKDKNDFLYAPNETIYTVRFNYSDKEKENLNLPYYDIAWIYLREWIIPV